MAPLLDVNRINQRLDAVEDLIAFQSATDVFRARVGKMPDLEKLLANIFTYSIKHKETAVYFNDVSLPKMREFRVILSCIRSVRTTI